MVLRSVRTKDEGQFIPHLALSISIMLAIVCVATLVFFVGHMAGRINVDTVVDLVSGEVQRAVKRLMVAETQVCCAVIGVLGGRDVRHRQPTALNFFL